MIKYPFGDKCSVPWCQGIVYLEDHAGAQELVCIDRHTQRCRICKTEMIYTNGTRIDPKQKANIKCPKGNQQNITDN